MRKSIAPRAGVGTEITPDKVLDDFYGFNRLLELVEGDMGDSLWDADVQHVLSGKKFGKTGGATGIGTWVPTPSYSEISAGGADRDSPGYQTWYTSRSGTVGSGVEFAVIVASNKTGGAKTDSGGARIVYNGSQVAYSGGGSTGTCCVWIGAVTQGKSWSTQYQSQTNGAAWTTGYGRYGEVVISGYP